MQNKNIKLIGLSAIAAAFFYAVGEVGDTSDSDSHAFEDLDVKILEGQIFLAYGALNDAVHAKKKMENAIEISKGKIDEGKSKMGDTLNNVPLCKELAVYTTSLKESESALKDVLKPQIELSEHLLSKFEESFKKAPKSIFSHSGGNRFFAKFDRISGKLCFEFSDGKKTELPVSRPYFFNKTAPESIEFLGDYVRPDSSGKDLAEFYFKLFKNGPNYNVEKVGEETSTSYKLTVPAS